MKPFHLSIHIRSVQQLLKWSVLIIPPTILAGLASAFFLWALQLREACEIGDAGRKKK